VSGWEIVAITGVVCDPGRVIGSDQWRVPRRRAELFSGVVYVPAWDSNEGRTDTIIFARMQSGVHTTRYWYINRHAFRG
jgi:hypothetical protein